MLDKLINTDQNTIQTSSMRIRVEFAKTEPMRFTSHLDLYRAWERLLRRAGLPLQFSQGYNPRPKLQLAAPLPLGMTSKVEIIDFWISGETDDLEQIFSLLIKSQPPGIDIHTVEFVDPASPPLQQEVSAAEYEVFLLDQDPQLNQKVATLVEAESIVRQRRNKSYDLRPLILALSIENDQPRSLRMRLSAGEGRTGRPEEVLLALEIQPENTLIERTRLVFKE